MMNLREFIDFNTNVSSEMFISVISIFQERLPCSQYIYRQKKLFKTQEFLKNQKTLTLSKTEKDDDALVAKAEEMCMSPLKAIANPKMLSQMSLKKQSTFRPETQAGSPSTNNSSIQTKKSSMQSSDFKIKKRVGHDSTR